jgi:hypothetical protein
VQNVDTVQFPAWFAQVFNAPIWLGQALLKSTEPVLSQKLTCMAQPSTACHSAAHGELLAVAATHTASVAESIGQPSALAAAAI